MAGAGAFSAVLLPVLGGSASAVTGFGHLRPNSLFGALQVTRRHQAGLTRCCGRVELLRRRAGQDDLAAEPGHRGRGAWDDRQEGDLFRKVLGWSLVFIAGHGAAVYLQVRTPCWGGGVGCRAPTGAGPEGSPEVGQRVALHSNGGRGRCAARGTARRPRARRC
jgi:hypothetical protein